MRDINSSKQMNLNSPESCPFACSQLFKAKHLQKNFLSFVLVLPFESLYTKKKEFERYWTALYFPFVSFEILCGLKRFSMFFGFISSAYRLIYADGLPVLSYSARHFSQKAYVLPFERCPIINLYILSVSSIFFEL